MLRVIHVWRSPPDDATHIGGASAMLRQVPEHPWPYAFLAGESRPGWTIGAAGDVDNVYVVNPDFVRLVPPEQRTPDETIRKLTPKQEFPNWRAYD